MHFPQFWKKVNDRNTIAWGWSDSSLEEATANAMERVQRIREWFTRGEHQTGSNAYGYPNRPAREQVLREFQAVDGQTQSAVVSRNSMGCLVLNTTDLMFVDVDQPETKTGGGGLIAKLFGRKKDKSADDPFEAKITATVDAWLQSHPGWGWRVYRTKAGARLLATHQPITTQEQIVQEAFATFNADPLYRDLCKRQECFRARLTAKPWRCGVPKLKARWPWEDIKLEEKFRKWEQRYLNAAKDYATCRLVGHFGSAEVHPALRELVEYHDHATGVDSAMPLA